MHIFYASDHTPNPSIAGSQLWYNNLYLPLVDLGHDVISFDYNLTPHFRNLNITNPKQKVFIDENRPKLEEALLRQIKEKHKKKPIDLFFSYFYSACCRSEIIKEISKLGIVTVNWYCNGSYQFHLVEEIAPAYDYCLVPEKFRLEDYRRIGANPIYVQEAANPNIYKPYKLNREFDVTFVGQRYGDRPEYLKYLIDSGIDVRIWGHGWQIEENQNRLKLLRNLKNKLKDFLRMVSPNSMKKFNPIVLPNDIVGPSLSDEELIKMYSRSKISLGFSSCGETHIKKRILQVRLRDFEAPMSGAFYMVEYMKELEEFFVPNKEIVCYHDKKDLKEKIKYYLSHDEEREKICKAGYRRATEEHSWHKRFKEVFDTIGLK